MQVIANLESPEAAEVERISQNSQRKPDELSALLRI
jgi:hypothetical protein